jgi:hypothetical protein
VGHGSIVAEVDEPDLAAAVAAAELLQQLQQDLQQNPGAQEASDEGDIASLSHGVTLDGVAAPEGFSGVHMEQPGQQHDAATASAAAEAAAFVEVMRPVHMRSRLRAEVSHASAPAPSRSISPAAIDTQQQQDKQQQQLLLEQVDKQQQHELDKHSKHMQQLVVEQAPDIQDQQQTGLLQQQQLMVHQPQQQQLQPAASTANKQLQQQQQQQPELSVALADVRVCVEGALNLQLPLLPEGEAF